MHYTLLNDIIVVLVELQQILKGNKEFTGTKGKNEKIVTFSCKLYVIQHNFTNLKN